MTFFPQFMPGGHAGVGHAFLLCAVFALLYLAWFGAYVLLVDRIGVALRRPRVRARIERITSVVLIGFAVRLAVQQS